MADLTHLRLERPGDGVALLVLDNPDLRNAMSTEMTDSWVAAIDELAGDPTVRAVVVTGEGTAFCSGGITSWIAGEPEASVDELRTRMIAFYRAWLSIRRLEVPTIAAINGATIGAGLCMALACDIRYATDTAKMGMPFLKLGHAPRHGRHVPAARRRRRRGGARPAAHRPRWCRARRRCASAWSRGCCRARGSSTTVLETAAQVAANAPIATRLTKIALAGGGHADLDTALQWEALAQPITLATADLQEGIAAVPGEAGAGLRGALSGPR